MYRLVVYPLLTLFFLSFIAVPLTGQTHETLDDFDFYMGTWNVKNRRQLEDGSWQEFDAEVRAHETLNGLGNVDFFESVVDGEPYVGMTVRTFDAESGQWHIRWIDSDDPSSFPEPSIGGFDDGVGKFYKTITAPSGREVTVRFLWKDITEEGFYWESGWSIDGENWNPVWTMEFSRRGS